MIGFLRRLWTGRTSECDACDHSDDTVANPEERERLEREKKELREKYHDQLNRLNVLKWKTELQSRKIPIPGESDRSGEKE